MYDTIITASLYARPHSTADEEANRNEDKLHR